jgi:glycosyltransferase involved in cell wall biosynthesis/SAM-dependent methyltransferase
MVVHNALGVVRVSTLRTLRHIAGQSARLVVVDNGSTDGAGEWLSLLARRGDIELIRNDFNIGHGPALELARQSVQSPYIVSLDSDAFPLNDRWLDALRSRINGHVKIAGIMHHRGYIHPSCLMIAAETMNDWRLTFLNEKSQPSRFDVAERMSHETRHRGHEISGLTRTDELCRGSASEPVYLGSTYEDIVYHQWYTTRAALSARVDDVPREAIDLSLKGLVRDFDAEPREVNIVVGVRAKPGEPERLRNAKACLWALNLQSIPRWRYRIILVEQDREPFARAELAPLADRYVFAYNPGPYNRAWAFNIGARLTGEGPDPLCLMDADILLSPESLAAGLEALAAGRNAFQPFREVIFLDRDSSERVIRERLSNPHSPLNVYDFEGSVFGTSRGGAIWVRSNLYHLVGGHDERFRGWGREDREFYERLNHTAKVKRLGGCILHLHHSRPDEEDCWAMANRALYDRISDGLAEPAPKPIGRIDLYAGEQAGDYESVAPAGVASGTHAHFERIIGTERLGAERRSTRWHLAESIVRLGGRVADVACGPGALWPHLEGRARCFGIDLDAGMISFSHRLFPDQPLARADAAHLPFPDGGIDIVVLRHVVEHLDAAIAARALSEAVRVARKSVIVDFHRPLPQNGQSRRHLAGDTFFPDGCLLGWRLRERFIVIGGEGESDEIWIFMSPSETAELERTITAIAAEGRPRISIVMPTYRRSHTILHTIETVRAQTYKNWELIIVDNAGDGGYRFGDPRIRVLSHKVGPSSSHARNQGVRHATGDFVCFFDDDDEMFPDYLESQVAVFVRNPNVKMVRCGMVVSDGRTNFSYATPECCLRRELATPTWEGRGGAQDQRYFSRIVLENDLALENGTVVIIPRALCRAKSDPHGGLRNGDF